MLDAETTQALVDQINSDDREASEIPVEAHHVMQVLVGLREMHQGWVRVKLQGDTIVTMPVRLDLYDQVSAQAPNISTVANG